MGISTSLIEAVSLIILSLIIFLVILTYILNVWIAYAEKQRQTLRAKIENYFEDLIEANKSFDVVSFHSNWKDLRILYPIFSKFDQTYFNNQSWQKNRMDIIHSLLLPLARKYSHSARWIKRFFVTEIFALVAEKQDEKAIIKLTEDKIPLVFFHSISAAITCESESAINNVINQLAQVGWATQLLYVEPFKIAPASIRKFVEKRLQTEKQANMRAACYKILMQFPPSQFDVIRSDLDSENFELRLATLKYIVHADKEKAVPILIEKLQDPHWEIRLKAVHRLGSMKIESALSQIANCLTDEDWWVKISAAEALKSLGKDGLEVLEARAPELVDIPFDATKHISHTLW